MDDIINSYEALADSEMWVDGATVLAGLAGPVVVENGIERFDAVPDLPSEAYGAIAILLAEIAPMGDYRRLVQVGAGTNALIHGTNRVAGGSAIDQYIPEV